MSHPVEVLYVSRVTFRSSNIMLVAVGENYNPRRDAPVSNASDRWYRVMKLQTAAEVTPSLTNTRARGGVIHAGAKVLWWPSAGVSPNGHLRHANSMTPLAFLGSLVWQSIRPHLLCISIMLLAAVRAT